MKLAPNAGAVLKKAWSAHLMYVAAALDGAVVLVELLGDQLPISLVTYALIRAGLTGASLIARVMVQKNLPEV